jgi:DNA-binding MarR family transcriptional regulator
MSPSRQRAAAARTNQPGPAPSPLLDETSVRAMDSLRRVVRVLSASAREVGEAGATTGAQRFVLRQIGAAPGLSVGELATRTLARHSAVSEVVSRLVAQGLVSRGVSATDARQAELRLTARGRHAIASMEETAQERLASGLASLSPSRRSAIADGLEAWLDAAGLAEVPAKMFFEEPAGPGARTRSPR